MMNYEPLRYGKRDKIPCGVKSHLWNFLSCFWKQIEFLTIQLERNSTPVIRKEQTSVLVSYNIPKDLIPYQIE